MTGRQTAHVTLMYHDPDSAWKKLGTACAGSSEAMVTGDNCYCDCNNTNSSWVGGERRLSMRSEKTDDEIVESHGDFPRSFIVSLLTIGLKP